MLHVFHSSNPTVHEPVLLLILKHKPKIQLTLLVHELLLLCNYYLEQFKTFLRQYFFGFLHFNISFLGLDAVIFDLLALMLDRNCNVGYFKAVHFA